MSHPLTHVASQLLNQPLACTPQHAALLIAVLHQRLNVDLLVDVEGVRLGALEMDQMAASGRAAVDAKRRARQEERIYSFQDGVAIIPVTGTLTKTWGLDPYSGMTGYDGIKAKHYAALEADDVEAMMFIHDSPGGAVAGNFDLADQIWATNKKNGGKLTYAVADELSASASFSLATSADMVWVPRTGIVGSVGIIMLHTEETEKNAKEGVRVNVLRSGAHKAEANPFEVLKPEVAARIQGELDGLRELFVETVARNMGVSKKSVRDTEASTYIGAAAREAGFANAVGSADQAWAHLQRRLGR